MLDMLKHLLFNIPKDFFSFLFSAEFVGYGGATVNVGSMIMVSIIFCCVINSFLLRGK